MRYLTQNEKMFLVLLITAALIMTAVSMYFGTNVQRKNQDVINNKIYIIHTGGDIEPDFEINYAKHSKKLAYYDVNSYDPPINSSDVVPSDWNGIAKDIGDVYNSYDAFVVVCGKDTLAYTASALSFMLENLGKPVILTDGELLSALFFASTTKIPEVMVASRGNLLRGCRVVHKSADQFTSPNYPVLQPYNALRLPQEPIKIQFVSPKVKVSVIKVFPGMDDKYLLNLLNDIEIHGIILEIYGSGRGPTNEKFLSAINRLAKRGVVTVVVSQCDKVSSPEVDMRLLEAGALSGNDMTVPAAFAKLCFLLGNVENKKMIGQLMEQTFRGEMTIQNMLT